MEHDTTKGNFRQVVHASLDPDNDLIKQFTDTYVCLLLWKKRKCWYETLLFVLKFTIFCLVTKAQ